jgi:hypothetical protein
MDNRARSAARAHLAEALRWSAEPEAPLFDVIASAVAMAGALWVGVACGQPALGTAAAIGALGVSTVDARADFAAHARALAAAAAPALLATIAAVVLAGRGWLTDALAVALAMLAATLGGYSRSLALGMLRFVLFLNITLPVVAASTHRLGLALLVVVGVLFASLVSLALGLLGHAPPIVADPTARVTTAQRYRRWRRTLTRLSGWQYALRLAACLILAALLQRRWPTHHLHWIALTVALLTQRRLEPLPIKMTQRALGTAVGVVAASLFVSARPSQWLLVLSIALLGGARRLVRARSYLAYSAIMTPLVLLLMSAAMPAGSGVLSDRLVATLVGAALVIVANAITKTAFRHSLNEDY